MADKTIALNGAETKIEYGGGCNAWLRNDGTSTVYAARTAGIAAGADGVVSVPAGGSAPVYGADGVVYLLGSGSVQLIGSDYSTNPFNGVSRGGAADIPTGVAGMVALDGLQGGVPFSKVVLDGDVVGQEVTLTVCGKNLTPRQFHSKSKTENGITFADNGDGSVSISGTATDVTYFYFAIPMPLCKGTYTISDGGDYTATDAYHLQIYLYEAPFTTLATTNNNATFTLDEDKKIVYRFRALKGATLDLTIKPQLERGASATAYEPYHGSEVKITPDAVPYTVPNDIRQQDGINNVMVSAGTVQVTGARRDAAIKKIWDKLDELTTAIIVSNGD